MTPLPKMRPRDVDMSPEAIDLRLRRTSELSKLYLYLASVQYRKQFRERERLAELEAASAIVAPQTGATTDEQKDNL